MKKDYKSPEIEISILEALTDILTGSMGAGGVTGGEDSGWTDWI